MSFPEKHIALVCNPTKENEKALRITDSIGVLLTGIDVRFTTYVHNWPEKWEDVSEVWVVGGDGTLNHFINQYPDIFLPISIFPGGSGNDFHWMLYGDKSVEQQVEQILEGRPHHIDAGICNNHLFLNGVGIGFDGAIVKDLMGRKKLAGKASYLLSILKHILGYHEKPCVIKIPGETISQECFMISVANARRYGGGFHVAPNASVTDELLDVNIIGKISPIKRMKYLPVIEKGAHLALSFNQYRQVNSVRIVSPHELHAHIDGEYIHDHVFEIAVLPKRFLFLL